MAFDGITIAAMVSELNKNLSGGRINKIAQPESDELLITGKGANGQKRLLLSASASLHASPQAHRKRQDHCDPPAWSGACCRI